MSLSVAELWRYPVKSLRGERHRQLALDCRGFELDRHWLLVDGAGRFLSQRQLPAMSRLAVALDGEVLRLENIDRPGEELRIARAPDGALRRVKIWGDHCRAVDMGEAAARWFSAQLGRPMRLCYMPDDEQRRVDPDYAGAGAPVGFADGFPLLIFTEASLQVLAEAWGRALDAQRFRPNIVIAGGEPFAEDNWRRVRIDGIEIEVVKPCSRCAIPTIDPESGKRQPALFALLREQRGRGRRVYFGQNAIHRARGVIREGAAVEVLE